MSQAHLFGTHDGIFSTFAYVQTRMSSSSFEITITLGIGSIFRDSLKLKAFKTDVIGVNSVSEKWRTQKDLCYITKEL